MSVKSSPTCGLGRVNYWLDAQNHHDHAMLRISTQYPSGLNETLQASTLLACTVQLGILSNILNLIHGAMEPGF